MNGPQPQETLLSSIHKFIVHNDFPARAVHPYASGSEAPTALLQQLVATTDNMAHSLQMYSTMSISNPKLVSLLREHAAISRSIYTLDQSTHQILDALKKRPETNYGEDVPSDRSTIISWSVGRLQTWGKAVGMEIFQDQKDGGISLMLGGKVIVIDIDLSVDTKDPASPTVEVTNVKTAYAIPNTSSQGASTSLDGLLRDSVSAFLTEVQKSDEFMSPREAARLGQNIRSHLSYLVMLDQLAALNASAGIQWFADVDTQSSLLELFSKVESEAVASTFSSQQPPLDIYLLRAHSLPLPYLQRPSLSFLVYLSPLAYLSLLRSVPKDIPSTISPNLPSFDIPLSHLRSSITSHSKGVTLATLSLQKSTLPIYPTLLTTPAGSIRPTFALLRAEAAARPDHAFPQYFPPDANSMNAADVPKEHYAWILDFTGDGQSPGVVMSQTRMREIESLVKQDTGSDVSDSMMTLNTQSWINILLNPGEHVSPERYTALYKSPTSAHPPLQLRLTAPDEPGFHLEKVHVCSMKQVWGILEIVKEQCWLNEILLGCNWTPEGLDTAADELPEEPADVTEEDLQAVLAGTLAPRKLPVNITLPSLSPQLDLDPFAFDDAMTILQTSATPSRPRIAMSSPERPPMSGDVQITVEYDETRPRGVKVEVSGMIGVELNKETMEEVARRGGVFGLPGRVWTSSRKLM
ncbi:Mediator complex subunit 1 [Pleurotus pulmonarius]